MGGKTLCPFDPSCIDLCYHRCLAHYWLTDRDLDDTSDYPPGCFPPDPATCQGATVKGFTGGSQLTGVGGESRWYKDDTAGPATLSLQLSNWSTTGWQLKIWIGSSCSNKSHTGTMTPSSFFGGASAGPGQFIWYELVATADMTVTLATNP